MVAYFIVKKSVICPNVQEILLFLVDSLNDFYDVRKHPSLDPPCFVKALINRHQTVFLYFRMMRVT